MTAADKEAPDARIEDYMSGLAWELDNDEGVGMWTIVPMAGYFGLCGGARVDFMRRAIHILLAHGAIAVEPGGDGKRGWKPVFTLGETPHGVVESVIADWLESGGGDPPWDSVWFKLPGTFKLAE